MIPYLRFAPYVAAAVVAGVFAGMAHHYQSKYEALRAENWQALAVREAIARKALEGQLAQAKAVSTNNAQVLHDLQTQTAAIVADRDRTADLVHRLLTRQARPATSAVLPKAADQPGTAPAGEAGGDEQVAKLLADTADECRGNAAQLNALIAQINPQL